MRILLCTSPAICAKFDMFIDKVNLLRPGALFGGSGKNSRDGGIDYHAFAITSDNRDYLFAHVVFL